MAYRRLSTHDRNTGLPYLLSNKWIWVCPKDPTRDDHTYITYLDERRVVLCRHGKEHGHRVVMVLAQDPHGGPANRDLLLPRYTFVRGG